MKKGSKSLDYEWMVKYTPQDAWIEGKGLFLWLAFFFTEICAGVYFVSLFLNFRAGLVIGWLGALVLGGFFHMLYLGKASRGWRILLKVATSELSRGLWITLLFGVFGFLQVLAVATSSLPWTWNSPVLKAIMGIICILVIIHGFTTMSVIKALPMWNSPMMIPLSFASGLWVGGHFVVMILRLTGSDVGMAEVWARWSLLFFMGALLVYIWGCVHASETARASVKRIWGGDLSTYFYTVVLLVGIIIPLIITLALWGRDPSGVNEGIFFLRFLCVLVGDAMMRYLLMKSPLYTPLI